jgi:hypothetical protein
MNDLSLGTVSGDSFAFIGNSGWALYDPVPANDPAPRSIAILRTH